MIVYCQVLLCISPVISIVSSIKVLFVSFSFPVKYIVIFSGLLRNLLPIQLLLSTHVFVIGISIVISVFVIANLSSERSAIYPLKLYVSPALSVTSYSISFPNLSYTGNFSNV